MLISPANNTKFEFGIIQGGMGNVAHLYSPVRGDNPCQLSPKIGIPYFLDNGAFVAHLGNESFTEKGSPLWTSYWAFIEYYVKSDISPEWVLIPDVVGDDAATLALWNKFAEDIYDRFQGRTKIALAVQDGMTPTDVDALGFQPDVIFIGGTDEYKLSTIEMWCSEFPNVHVGRVNSLKRAFRCLMAGAASIDGTGWCRGGNVTARHLNIVSYIAKLNQASPMVRYWISEMKSDGSILLVPDNHHKRPKRKPAVKRTRVAG